MGTPARHLAARLLQAPHVHFARRVDRGVRRDGPWGGRVGRSVSVVCVSTVPGGRSGGNSQAGLDLSLVFLNSNGCGLTITNRFRVELEPI